MGNPANNSVALISIYHSFSFIKRFGEVRRAEPVFLFYYTPVLLTFIVFSAFSRRPTTTTAMEALKRQRRQWTRARKLALVALIVAVTLLTSISLFHALKLVSDCSTYSIEYDVPIFIPIPTAVTVPTSLAAKQSYDLFDDIPDQRWELMRKRAHEAHTYVQEAPSSKPKHESYNPIMQYMVNLEVSEDRRKQKRTHVTHTR